MTNFQLKINNIKQSEDYSDEQLFMIESINNCSGFLLGNNKVYFINKSDSSSSESIVTSHLTLRTSISINTIENYPTFNPGYYDVLAYNNFEEENYLESFVELCKMYVVSSSQISFRDFFYSLLKLFEPNKETSFTNLIGVVGELFFIKRLFDDYGIVVSDNWHNSLGSSDKYDFSFKDFNVEIKTSLKDTMIFEIKHKQIFNEKQNFVAVINIELDNSGQSMEDLYSYFKSTKPFSENIEFAIKLESEKQKVSPMDFASKKFNLLKVTIFSNKELVTIENIPEWINSVKYSYDFVSQKDFALNNLVEMIKNSKRNE